MSAKFRNSSEQTRSSNSPPQSYRLNAAYQTLFMEMDEAKFEQLLLAYHDAIPQKLATLDRERFEVIPEHLRTGVSALTKDQAVTLVDWKLYAMLRF